MKTQLKPRFDKDRYLDSDSVTIRIYNKASRLIPAGTSRLHVLAPDLLHFLLLPTNGDMLCIFE